MRIEYTPWPAELAEQYRAKGYWQDKPLTSILSEQLNTNSQGIAVADGQRQLSYAELNTYSDNLAGYLNQQGLQQGDTAIVQLPNCLEFYITYFALLKLGVAPVCALFNHQRTELQSYCEILQPKAMIVSSAHALFTDEQFTQALFNRFGCLNNIIIDHSKGNSELKQGYLNKHAFTAPDLNPEEVAFFQLSGGSTGTPKLIPRTHNDYLYSVVASKDICELDGDTRYLCALPAPHNFPLSSPGALGVFIAGGTVILASDPSPAVCFGLIEHYAITHTALVPPALQLWLQHAPASQHDLNSLQVIQVGGAKLSRSVAEQVTPVLGCQLQQVFGMAEGLVNYTRYNDDPELILTTQGRPISELDEIKIVDEHGQEVAQGESGRLMTRGPYTFRGYYKSPTHNASAFDDAGFYSSGDIVKQLPSGHLVVEGRDKDQINRGGEKIAAEEVENHLLGHEHIQQVAIVSMPDDTLGEKSCAFVVADQDIKLTTLILRKYLRQLGIADYKVPDKFKFVTQLPLTAVGKVDKKALRATFE
ncbi:MULTISPECIES: (2,3-dihydroxybenzoyl)adenylate synthase [Pseudoalteromonas]|uniref:(2,3-dihydroxybenzoyl)adenylate synthase n=1 Tax=Pseudoalteromonas obscura TaxID=3048491 RepID=A0ABT7ESR9_9GAMM|nr:MULTISPECIES: (2,3-dihydroxybenzoyl)adenylate synthase [Pseudoalteromonas]MBQ4839266.1 (2,3-dihydroxybenzoyl)adenylate synthase [Pseudoalteromonas luteoviolacea]MDK2598107.1 (2,3-dihydroxybenzoyl)adenylate synthase [Pseudoalteromonas sp. P94(2023)]